MVRQGLRPVEALGLPIKVLTFRLRAWCSASI